MKNLFKNKIIKTVIIIESVLIIIYPLLILVKLHLLPSQIPLFYSRPRGNDQLVPIIFLYFFPLFHLAILILHLIGVKKLMIKYPVASYALLFTSNSALILLILTFIRIIFLVS